MCNAEVNETCKTVLQIFSPAHTMPKLCGKCQKNKAVLKRPKTLEQICRECFFEIFEDEIHQTIVSAKLFKKGEKVAIAASGIIIFLELSICKCVLILITKKLCSLPVLKISEIVNLILIICF